MGRLFLLIAAVYVLIGIVAFISNCSLSNIFIHSPAEGFSTDEAKVLLSFSIIAIPVLICFMITYIFYYKKEEKSEEGYFTGLGNKIKNSAYGTLLNYRINKFAMKAVEKGEYPSGDEIEDFIKSYHNESTEIKEIKKQIHDAISKIAGEKAEDTNLTKKSIEKKIKADEERAKKYEEDRKNKKESLIKKEMKFLSKQIDYLKLKMKADENKDLLDNVLIVEN